MKLSTKKGFLLFFILVLNLGFVAASDDNFALHDLDNGVFQDTVLCDELDDCSDIELEDNEGSDIDSFDDLGDDSLEFDSVENDDIGLRTDGIGEEYQGYVDDIQYSSSENYYAFFRYLVDDCGFEFRNTSNLGDGYLLYATTNYTGLLFDGEEFTILPDEYYFVSTNERLPYYVYHNYYEDIVYCYEDNYVLDEEYLGWIIWNTNITNPDLSFGTLDGLNIGEFSDYSSRVNEGNTRDVDLPSSYDLRDYGFVTPVKDQGQYGNCWAFATMAALESYLLKFENLSYDLSEKWDFSENNLKNVMSSRGRNGTDWEVNNGVGNIFVPLAYLLRWSGPTNETDDPYYNNYTISEENLDPLKHVQGVKFIPTRNNYLDNNAIKEAIYNYGGVVVTMYWADSLAFLNNGKNYYFQSDIGYNMSHGAMHSVTIVGWDDNYSRENFVLHPDHMGDGAFIIKNSWGETSGENGYYYVSYYDDIFGFVDNLGFTGFAFTSVENTSNYDNNYNYNPLGLTSYATKLTNQVTFANQWGAEKNETLKSYGLYIFEPYNCEIKVFVNGVHIGGTTYSLLDYPGFHTIYLNQSITINQGDVYRIQVTLTNENSNHVLIPLEQRIANYSKVSADFNQSFIYDNGWVDVNSIWENTNICLHAFTEFVPDLVSTEIVASDLHMVYNSSSLNATLRAIDGSPLAGKRISFSFNNKTYYRTSDSNGKVSLHIGLFPGSYVFEIRFLGDDDCYQSTKLVTVTVTKKSTNIVCTATSIYYNGKLNFTLKDSSGNVLANKKVAFYIKGKTYKRVTDSNGRAFISINLNNGTVPVKMKFFGDRSYSVKEKTINLLVKKAPARLSIPSYQTTHNSGEYYKITVINNKTNNVITGTKINITVTGGSVVKNYNRTTDSNGIAWINLSRLDPGTYHVTIRSLNSNVVFTPVTRTIKILNG